MWWIEPKFYPCQILLLCFFFLIRLLQFQFSIEMEIGMCKCRIGKWDWVGQRSISESAESRYIFLYSLLYSEDAYSSWQMSLIIRHTVLHILSVPTQPLSPIEPHVIREKFQLPIQRNRIMTFLVGSNSPLGIRTHKPTDLLITKTRNKICPMG